MKMPRLEPGRKNVFAWSGRSASSGLSEIEGGMQKSTVPGEEGEIFVIDGQMFSDIPGFYAELNRIFMADEEWQLGQSLDALDPAFPKWRVV